MAAAHHNDAVTHYLSGDMCQMAAQLAFLKAHGFTVGIKGGIPGLYNEDDYKWAVQLFWDQKVVGWWTYERRLEEYGICTKEEYRAALHVAANS